MKKKSEKDEEGGGGEQNEKEEEKKGWIGILVKLRRRRGVDLESKDEDDKGREREGK